MGLSRRERREQRRKLLKDQRIHELKESEESFHHEKGSRHKGIIGIYDKHYKKLLLIPIIIFIASVIILGIQVATTGELINKGVSLKGGVVVTIPVETPVSINEVESLLRQQFPKDDLEIRSVEDFGVQKAVMVTSERIGSEKEIISALSSMIPGANDNYSSETTGESLGSGFFKQVAIAIVVAFIFMALVVLISFRNFVPSAAVVFCVFADMVETLVVVNLLGVKLSTAGIAAFLMLIGYSVDTDILLTTRVLKGKEGSVFDRILGATKTGLMMTSTAIVAVVISLFVTSSAVIKEIMLIMLFGLLFDIINTWLQNTALLRLYIERKRDKPVKSEEVEPEIIDIDE